jgi:hypothetical protein
MLEDMIQSSGQKLSAQERKQFTAEAMHLLEEMAMGKIKGYDLRPAQPEILNALRSEELAPQAIQILGRLPGVMAQQRLAQTALDPAKGKLRLLAARELNRNIRLNGPLLNRAQLQEVRRAFVNPKEAEDLRTEFALVLSHRDVGSRITGLQLRDYNPAPPAPPPPPQPKKE